MTDQPTDTTQDPNVIEITDDDGNVVHTIHIDVCNQVADDVMDAMWELEEVMENFDFVTACFGLFVNSIHVLTSHGWTAEDLIQEVHAHAQTEDTSLNRTLN